MIFVKDQGRLKSEPHCLKCDSILDGVSSVGNDSKPSADDITICAYCGHGMAFTGKQLTLRELTDEETERVDSNPIVIQIRRASATMRKRNDN